MIRPQVHRIVRVTRHMGTMESAESKMDNAGSHSRDVECRNRDAWDQLRESTARKRSGLNQGKKADAGI